MQTETDILVIGGEPAGLSFVKSMANTDVKLTLIEKSSVDVLKNPPPDGREIALTHHSKEMLTELGAWDYLHDDEKYYLREAKVFDGDSPFTLHFPTPTRAMGKAADTLGYLISNHNIRKSLYAQVEGQANLTLKTGTVVSTLEDHQDFIRVQLDNGETINARLVIAADSRFSNSRRQMGIATDMHDFARTVIVFRMSHTLSNENTAMECFHYGRTLAVLPLSDYLSSMVITIDSCKADTILSLTPEQLREDLMGQLDGRLGDMKLEGELHQYPLVGVHARKFYSNRYALIGDAAVGMHPVTAHGFNLGLESQKILTDLIKAKLKKGEDFADISMLEKYSKKHRRHTLPLYHGTNVIVKLFTNENPLAKIARKAALRAGNGFLPFKWLVSKQLTG